MIALDVGARSLTLDVDGARWRGGAPRGSAPEPPAGGYAGLYVKHVQQADRGADFDFLVGCRGKRRDAGIALTGSGVPRFRGSGSKVLEVPSPKFR